MENQRASLTVVAVIEYEGRFLMIHRNSGKSNYPGLWAFPGGKVNSGETAIDALRREVREETGIEISDEASFLNTFKFGNTVGITFLVKAKSGEVRISDEARDSTWVSSAEDIGKLNCIPGIHNHLKDALLAIEQNRIHSLDEMNLLEEKYLNQN